MRDHLSGSLLGKGDRVAADLEWRHVCNNVTSDINTQHLLQQGPGLEEAEAGVAGVQVETQRGVKAPPAVAGPQGGGQLALGPGHCT